MEQKTRVAVVYGGTSNEREVSLQSGKNVIEHIDSSLYDVVGYDLKDTLADFVQDALQKKFDVVFPILHGIPGEDGTIQGLCELLNVPYVGCGVEASAVCMNKETAKRIAMTQGMLTPEFTVFFKDEPLNLSSVDVPCVIKPALAGSSVGVSIPQTYDEIKSGIDEAFTASDRIIIEQYIQGREFTVGIIGTPNDATVLPPTEIIANAGAFYDYASKYQDGGSTHVCPADLSETLTEQLQNLAKRAFKLFNGYGMMRVDFMFDEKEQLFYFIEANTLPGMTNTSLLPEAAKAADINFTALLTRLLETAEQR